MNLTRYIAILLAFISVCAPAQIKKTGTPYCVNFPKSQYNAGMQNWNISQDSRGFLYFANAEGVLRFDGFHWDLIKTAGTSPVRSVLVDKDDNIYIGKSNDFGVLKNNKAGFPEYISLRGLLKDGVPEFDDVWRIFETSEGIVFQCYDYLFVLSDGRVETIKPANRLHFSFQANDKILLHEPGFGLSEFKNGKTIPLSWSLPLKDFDIEAIFDYGNGDLLIGTARMGVYILRDNKLEKWNSPVSVVLMENILFSSEKLSEDLFVWGTILDGLYITDREGNIIQHINRKAGLLNNTVLDLFHDKNSNLWVGLDNGISYLEVNSPLSFISDPDMLGAGYSSLVHNGFLYLGTNRGLFLKPWKDFQANRGDFRLVDGTEGQVWSLQVFDGQLICGHNLGTFIIEGRRATSISTIEGAWKFIRIEGHPDYLVGGHYTGLMLLKKSAKGWVFDRKIDGIRESCRFLGQDIDGDIWVSHGGKGIFRLTLAPDLASVSNIRHFTSKEGLPSDEQNILMEFNREFYVSTVNGIYKYDEKRDLFEADELINELFGVDDRVMSMVTDNNGNIWYISETGCGVLRINEDKTYTRILSPFNKLLGSFVSEFEFIYPYDDKNVFFGTDNGFAHYSTDVRKSYTDEFKTFITKVEMPYLDSVIYKAGNENLRELSLPFRKNSFRFHFTSPWFESIDKLKFSYHLHNFDDVWSEWTDDSYKDFTNLREGDYTFRVKAKNAFGIESIPAELQFTILPPWYRSRIALYSYIILFAAFIYVTAILIRRRVNNLRTNQIKAHEKELRERNEQFQRETLIAEKELIKIRNEKLQNEMIHRDKELANQTMGIIQKNRFLMKLKAEMGEMLKSVSDNKLKARMITLDKKIDREINIKQQNKVFETYFDGVHSEFFKRLKDKHPDLSPREMYLSAYLRMNLTTKEISALQNITDRGVEIGRYRLRKKLKLAREVNLSTYLSNI